MKINGATALVTGANRGLGRVIAQRLLERGAAKVYAAARRPETIDLDGVEPIALDVTDPGQARRAAGLADDVDLLVNNAGIGTFTNLIGSDMDQIRLMVETNAYGPLHLARAFAPVLAANGGGAIVNVLSISSWLGHDGATAYHLSKAAGWAVTNGIRLDLAKQGTLVTAVHCGMIDTEMASWSDDPKLAPAEVAQAALDGVEAGLGEVLVDDVSRQVKSGLAG